MRGTPSGPWVCGVSGPAQAETAQGVAFARRLQVLAEQYADGDLSLQQLNASPSLDPTPRVQIVRGSESRVNRARRDEWGQRNTKSEALVTVCGKDVAARGTAGVPLIEVPRPAAQHAFNIDVR